MGFLEDYFEDKDHGGLFHAMSEDFATVRDSNKYAHEQFTAARTSVIGAMITHEPTAIEDAENAVKNVMQRFEDTRHGGYFSVADRNWKIIDTRKYLSATGELFGVLMHLYEVSKNDAYLLKALDLIDIALSDAWDMKWGGFFSWYSADWNSASDSKDLETQATMLQHLNGSWKDGMDSPYGARSAKHRKRAEEFADLLLQKCADGKHGGFYTKYTADWRPASHEKDVGALASFALALYFHYHNMGPSIWGPRKGSHAYTGAPYPALYAYRGPAPNCEPVSEKAYRYGRVVVDLCDLLLQCAWDDCYGGFYTSLSERLEPEDTKKLFETQVNCLLALNVGYRLTGFKRFQQKLSEAVGIIEEKCFDAEYGGVYSAFDRSWQPICRDKECGLNLMGMGILNMIRPIVEDREVTRQPLCLWLEPQREVIHSGESARFTITVQNLGFETFRIRIGGLSSPSRWMRPDDIVIELKPHEVYSYQLTIEPPPGMPVGRYPFEITCMPDGQIRDYVSVSGLIILS